MSRKKTPAVFEPPKLWIWWKMEGYYSHVLLPFKPTAIEFWWARMGAPPQPFGHHYTTNIDNHIEAYGLKTVRRARNMRDADPVQHWGGGEIQRILDYAAIRHLHPLQTPQKMDFSHW